MAAVIKFKLLIVTIMYIIDDKYKVFKEFFFNHALIAII